jgi:hypothetical protein
MAVVRSMLSAILFERGILEPRDLNRSGNAEGNGRN